MKGLLKLAVVLGLAALMREQLVDLLTKTTGTWVGSPQD